MRQSRKRIVAAISTGALLCGLGVAMEVPASALSCAITDISISAIAAGTGSYAYGYGAGYCSGGTGTTERLNMQVLHNYDALPDPVIVDKVDARTVNSTKVNFSMAGGRCDNSTKAQYYSKSQITAKTPWSLTANKVIQTCPGTYNY